MSAWNSTALGLFGHQRCLARLASQSKLLFPIGADWAVDGEEVGGGLGPVTHVTTTTHSAVQKARRQRPDTRPAQARGHLNGPERNVIEIQHEFLGTTREDRDAGGESEADGIDGAGLCRHMWTDVRWCTIRRGRSGDVGP